MVRPLRLALAAILAASLGGCPRSDRPFTYDSGPGVDAPSFLDTDLDGLCDTQETNAGTRLDDPDSDDDGYSDLAELSLGFDPWLPASPERETLVFLDEEPGAVARTSLVVTVNGMGETYLGAFSAIRQTFDDGQSAGLFFDGASVIGAEPMANVFMLDGERAIGVRGRTRLVYEIRFRFGEDDPPLRCIRAYPFQYLVRRDDGRTVGAGRFTVVVQPSGAGPGAGTWCGASPCW